MFARPLSCAYRRATIVNGMRYVTVLTSTFVVLAACSTFSADNDDTDAGPDAARDAPSLPSTCGDTCGVPTCTSSDFGLAACPPGMLLNVSPPAGAGCDGGALRLFAPGRTTATASFTVASPSGVGSTVHAAATVNVTRWTGDGSGSRTIMRVMNGSVEVATVKAKTSGDTVTFNLCSATTLQCQVQKQPIVARGQPHRLTLDLDGAKIGFSFDCQRVQELPETEKRSAAQPNTLQLGAALGDLDATFDDVILMLTPIS